MWSEVAVLVPWLCVVLESGRYVALDLGGTNFRVLLVELNGCRDERPNVVSKLFLIPLRIMLGTGIMVSPLRPTDRLYVLGTLWL